MLLIFILYSLVWFVPLALLNRRKATGQRPYYLVCLFSCGIEIVLILGFLKISEGTPIEFISIYLAPIFSLIVAGYFYIQFTKHLDSETVNKIKDENANNTGADAAITRRPF